MCLLYRYDCVCFIFNPYCLVGHVYTGIVLPLPPTLRLCEIFIITTDLRRPAVAKVNTPTSNQTAEDTTRFIRKVTIYNGNIKS